MTLCLSWQLFFQQKLTQWPSVKVSEDSCSKVYALCSMCCACAGSCGMCRSTLTSILLAMKCHFTWITLHQASGLWEAHYYAHVLVAFDAISSSMENPFHIFWNRKLHLERLVWIDVPSMLRKSRHFNCNPDMMCSSKCKTVKDLSGDSLRSPLNLIFNLCVESSSCMNISVYPFKEPSIEDVFNVLDFLLPPPCVHF